MTTRPFIVFGDQTDHGGRVIESSVMTNTHGKGIARVGDQVTCPKKGHGTTVIVTGDPTMVIDGKAAARHGDKCACGATLISSQFVSTVCDSRGGASSGAAMHGDVHDDHASSMAMSSPPMNDDNIIEQYFEVLGQDGQPVHGYKFDLFAADELHTRSAQFQSGKTTSVNGAHNVRLVMWTAVDGGARHA